MKASIKRDNDRRVLKTKQAIKEAFGRLASQKDYRKITVTALAEEANIDRKTFYLHYPSIEELMKELARNEAQRMVEEVRLNLPEGSSKIDPVAVMDRLNEVASRHHTLSSESAAYGIATYASIEDLLALMEKPLTEELLTICKTEHADEISKVSELHVSYSVTFFVAGLLAVYKRWLSEKPEASLEDLSYELKRNMADGLTSVLDAK